MRTPARLLVLLAVLLAAACSGDDDAVPPSEDTSTTPGPSRDEAHTDVGDTGDGGTGERPAEADVTVKGPVPGDPQTSGASTLAGTGYVAARPPWPRRRRSTSAELPRPLAAELEFR